MSRLSRNFFNQDVLDVAPNLLGAEIVMPYKKNLQRYTILEVEAYRGTEDLACHASKGKTSRTEIMYSEGGHIYVYLIYGIYWMLNVVSGIKNNPQAILIRGIKDCYGPGRVSKLLAINKSFYGEDLCSSSRIWIEKTPTDCPREIITQARVGIDYAGDIWRNKPWRFSIKY